MRRGLLALVALVAVGFASPASAHKLKVFAGMADGAVAGYAFFIGGGRAAHVPWRASDLEGRTLAEGETDAAGAFRFAIPSAPGAFTVTVDTQEGHMASATLTPTPLAGTPPAPSGEARSAPEAGAPREATAALVEAAVQRQMQPLLARIEEMDGRLRFTDMMSGVFLIFGLAGMALWARGRRR